VLDALREAGVVEAAVVAPPDVADEIAACVGSEGPAGIAVCHLIRDGGDSGDALLAAAEFVSDAPCILHRADGLLGQPLRPFLEPLREESPDVLVLVQDGGSDAQRLRLVPERLLIVTEDQATPVTGGGACVCLLGPGALRRVLTAGRSAQGIDFAALAERLACTGGRAQVRVVRTWRHFAGDTLDLLDMNRTLLDALESETTPSSSDGNHFEGHVAIHPTACVTSSVIIGPVIVGAGALITNSYIGPHTSIAEGVRIEGAELERSIVLADASVLHVGGRLVASVVGRKTRIFRDFSVPRALRFQVSDGDEVALC
jgi:glucose-1-phosphate thymidylyltransferase